MKPQFRAVNVVQAMQENQLHKDNSSSSGGLLIFFVIVSVATTYLMMKNSRLPVDSYLAAKK
jgi:UDP-N-acetylmuramyl pentapeptide phosphotransferase/UDP-N-acetylglucosamine-1-phosphate transferase